MMRVAIIALILAIAALGLGSFATFRSFDSKDTIEAVPIAASWSEAECERAREGLWAFRIGCTEGSCDAYADMLLAIANNCE